MTPGPSPGTVEACRCEAEKIGGARSAPTLPMVSATKLFQRPMLPQRRALDLGELADGGAGQLQHRAQFLLVKVASSPVPWISTNRPPPVSTTFKSTAAAKSS